MDLFCYLCLSLLNCLVWSGLSTVQPKMSLCWIKFFYCQVDIYEGLLCLGYCQILEKNEPKYWISTNIVYLCVIEGKTLAPTRQHLVMKPQCRAIS